MLFRFGMLIMAKNTSVQAADKGIRLASISKIRRTDRRIEARTDIKTDRKSEGEPPATMARGSHGQHRRRKDSPFNGLSRNVRGHEKSLEEEAVAGSIRTEFVTESRCRQVVGCSFDQFGLAGDIAPVGAMPPPGFLISEPAMISAPASIGSRSAANSP